MTITWVVESDVFNESHYGAFLEHLGNNGLPYHVVRVVPFIHEIEGKVPKIEDGSKVVVYGSIGTQKLAQKHGWTPGVWTNDNFNTETYAKKLGHHFLNTGAVICKMSEVMSRVDEVSSDDLFFIKPNSDTKEFAGAVMAKDEFEAWYAKMVSIGYLNENDFDVAISEPIQISVEYRLFVVGGKIVAGSRYREFGIVRPKEGWLPDFQTIIDDIGWHPADVYVIDVGLTINGWKVIEYNTFNSAGFYDAKISAIIDGINEYMGTQQN